MTASNSNLNKSNNSKGFFQVLAAPFARLFHPISQAEMQRTLDESAKAIESAQQAQAQSTEVLKKIDAELNRCKSR